MEAAAPLYEENKYGKKLIGYYNRQTGMVLTPAGTMSGAPGTLPTKAHLKRLRASQEPDLTFRGEL